MQINLILQASKCNWLAEVSILIILLFSENLLFFNIDNLHQVLFSAQNLNAAFSFEMTFDEPLSVQPPPLLY